jgi:hypothetical protein
MSDIHHIGFLYDDSGDPVVGATVQAYVKDSTTTAGSSTTTNSDGKWSITTTSDNQLDIKITSGSSVRYRKFSDAIQVSELEVGTFNIREAQTAQVYTIAPGSISADRTLTLPAATGSDTLASLGLAQTFTANQAFTGTVTVGTDGSGTDVILYSGTSGDNVTWDASEEVLQITGTDGATALDVLDGDVRVVDKLYLYDRGGEYLSSDGSTLTITGATTVSGGLTSTAASNTLGATSFNDAAITNVGDIALDSISADGTDINIAVDDNSATALTIKQGSDAYLIVDTANSSESVSIGTGISGTAITLGHGTSEVTVADNLTVSGNLTVTGTTTSVDSTTINVTNAFVFEGATADAHETTLGIIDPTADATLNLPAMGAGTYYLPVLAAATTTSITSTPAELNLLDGSSANTVVNSKAVIYGSGGEVAGTLSTAAQTNVTSLATLTALTVDDVAVDGKIITMTGSSGDTAVLTVGTNGTLSLVTTDAAAAAANIQITADGTVDIDSAGVLTLDSGAAINIEPASGSAILLDGTISIDAGVVTGATSITSTAFVGAVDGAVGGNTPAAIAGTTIDASTDFTIGTTVITDDVITFTPTTSDTVVLTATTNGAFSLVTTDNAAAAANIQITADGTVDIDSAGVLTLDSGAAINIEPASGSAVLIDGTVSIDGGAVTGVTDITASGAVSGATIAGNMRASAAQTTAGSSADLAVTPDGLAGSVVFGTRYVQCVVFDSGTDIAEGNGKFFFHIPAGLNGMELVETHARVATAGNGSAIQVQLFLNTSTTNAATGNDMLTNLLTIDDGELDSSDSSVTQDIDETYDDVDTNDMIRIDVDGNGGDTTIAKGLIVTLGFRLP